jgi:hypothetical protein
VNVANQQRMGHLNSMGQFNGVGWSARAGCERKGVSGVILRRERPESDSKPLDQHP